MFLQSQTTVAPAELTEFTDAIHAEFTRLYPDKMDQMLRGDLDRVLSMWTGYEIRHAKHGLIGVVMFGSGDILHILVFEKFRKNANIRDIMKQTFDLAFQERELIVTRIDPAFPQAIRLAQLSGAKFIRIIDGDHEYSLTAADRRM